MVFIPFFSNASNIFSRVCLDILLKFYFDEFGIKSFWSGSVFCAPQSHLQLNYIDKMGADYYITVETKKKEDVTSIEISTKNTRNYVTIIFDTKMKKCLVKRKFSND